MCIRDSPGIFRGAFDVRASDINDEMKIAASKALADLITDEELSPEYIIPKMCIRDRTLMYGRNTPISREFIRR